MAEIVANLLVDPAVDDNGSPLPDDKYDANVRKVVKYVRSLKAQDLVQHVAGKPLTELLDPTRNTIGYLAVLLALAKQGQLAQQVALIHYFVVAFDAIQARYVGPELRSLVEWLAELYDRSQDASVIPYMRSIILRLDPESSTFTSNHLLLLRVCLGAHLPRQALPVLDKDLYNLPIDPQKNVDEAFPCSQHQISATFITKSSGISAQLVPSDVHEYYLLGAQVYIGLRNFERARLFLELVLVSPSNHVATHLMVEAYKKLILVGLLSSGSHITTKGLLDSQTQKAVSSLSRAYELLAEIFVKRNVSRFTAEVDAATAIWDEDGNTAIVNQVAESLRRYRVIDLQKTYSALPIDRIATYLNMTPEATTTLLTTIISDGDLKAVLAPSAPGTTTAPILRFLSHDPNRSATTNQDSLLQEKYSRVEQLAKHVREADRRLAVQKEYVDYVRRNKRADAAGASGFEDPMEMWETPDAGDQDEDMMADL